jgi:hypothetical protein
VKEYHVLLACLLSHIYLFIEEPYDQQSFSNKRPVDESDGYEQQVTKKMRVEAGDGPNTLLRILVNSKDAGGIIGKVCSLLGIAKSRRELGLVACFGETKINNMPNMGSSKFS